MQPTIDATSFPWIQTRGSRSRALRDCAFGVALLGLAAAAGVSAALHFGALNVISLVAVALAIVIMIWAADLLLADGRLQSQRSTFSIDRSGLTGQILPARLVSGVSGTCVYRTPILRIPIGSYPQAGIPWSDLTVKTVLGRVSRDGTTAYLRVSSSSRKSGGLLLFSGVARMAVSPAYFPEVAASIIERGGSVEILLFGRSNAARGNLQKFGKLVQHSAWFRLAPGLSAAQVKQVVTIIDRGSELAIRGGSGASTT